MLNKFLCSYSCLHNEMCRKQEQLEEYIPLVFSWENPLLHFEGANYLLFLSSSSVENNIQSGVI